MRRISTHRSQGMSFTVNSSSNLEVVIRQLCAAIHAYEASPLILASYSASWAGTRRLEILAFDASVAAVTQRAILLVVVLLAVWMVVDDIEVGACEGFFARLAYET